MTGVRMGDLAVPDLRSVLPMVEVRRVERSFDVRLDTTAVVRKRRTLGFPTDRHTWVRIEIRRAAKMSGWNGVESAAVLHGVAKPGWHQSVAWADPAAGVVWRADEMDLITAAPVKPGGVLTVDPDLAPGWWDTFNASLSALATQTTDRVATPHSQPISQARITATINEIFPVLADTVVDEWATAHADVNWANLTAPDCWLLDWEDWGRAPRGLDAAYLWSASLAVPELASRVRRERQADLDTRSGLLTQLFYCAELIAAGADYAGPLFEPARHHADELVTALQAPRS